MVFFIWIDDVLCFKPVFFCLANLFGCVGVTFLQMSVLAQKIGTENRRKTTTTAKSNPNSKCAELEISKSNVFSCLFSGMPILGLG